MPDDPPGADELADFLLDADEFDALTDDERELYLDLLAQAAKEWVLLPKQRRADELADACDDVLFGGSAGPGKSLWLLYRAWRLSRMYPGHVSLLIRRTHPELKRTLIRKSTEWFARCTPPDERPRWRAGEKEWWFPNGSIIEFGHCEADADVQIYLSGEYDFIGFDELTTLTAYQYEMIRSRARTSGAKLAAGVRPHTAGCTNPGSKGHVWVKKLFVDSTDRGQKIAEVPELDPRTGEEHVRTIAYIHSTVHDNPFIDPGYARRLHALPAIQRRQYLDGDWDVFAGQFFAEWDEQIHVYDDFDLPESWPRKTAVDYGFSAPWCCLWGAWDNDGDLWVYRERYERGLTPAEQAQMILEAERATGEKVMLRVGDPSMWNRTGHGAPISSQYATEGVHMIKAMNDRRAGWGRVRQYLRPLTTPGEPTRARIHIARSCVHTIRTLPEQVHEPTDKQQSSDDAVMEEFGEDLDTTGEDHAADALRYLCMTQEVRAPVKPHRVTNPDADWYLDRLAQKARKRRW